LGSNYFSRDKEEEADRLGVQYMWASGYDPNAMATMFEKLEAKNKKKPGTISKLFATHPAPPDRRAAAISLATRFPEREEYIISSSEFQRVKNRLLRLSNARVTNNGVIAGSDDGTPGRPTLKRRQPTPDDATTTAPDGTQKPDANKPAPPSLRREGQPQPSPTPQP
ncbi:MAG: M48 family metalloprotease, partial [Acidobacteriota bacterium]